MAKLKTSLVGIAALMVLAQAPAVRAQSAQIARPMAAERQSAGRQMIDIDMGALADPAPASARTPATKGVSTRLAVATTSAESAARPVATSTGSGPRKRFPHPAGLYQDAPLIALLGWAN